MCDNYIKSEKFFEPSTELLLRTVRVQFNYKSSELSTTISKLFNFQNVLLRSDSNKLILKNCTINVPKGKIYSLLGSSGCGKTTLLKCILGLEHVSSGTIKIFQRQDDRPAHIKGSNVGYMPQELALLEELTVEQTLRYFGRLHKMKSHLIEEKIEFLVKFLEIPDRRRVIYQLSGGQKRRVSLAAAIIHYPSLLILDEPTVGVDPLLRHSIWQYLQKLCRTQHMTIIITTHYIEEAINSDIIGLMRNGRLLVEGQPKPIIAYFNCNNMEEVFLKLCESRNSLIECQLRDRLKEILPQSSPEIRSEFPFSFKTATIEKPFLLSTDNRLDLSRFWSLFIKNWHLIRGNPRSLLFLYLLPSISVSLFALSMGAEPKNIRVSVYNEEQPKHLSEYLIQDLNESGIIEPILYESYESAVDSLVGGHSWAMVYLHSEYSTKLEQRINENLYSDNQTISDSNIVIQLDNTSPIISYTIIRTLLESVSNMIEKQFTNGKSVIQSISPLDIVEVTYGSPYSIKMTDYFAPGILMATIFIAPWPFVLFSITKEKKIKFLARSLISGANSMEVLFSNLSLQLIILFTQVSILMFTAFYIWRIQNTGSLIIIALILYLIGVVGILFAVIITYVCANEGEAFILTFSLIIPLWLVSGILWPNESLSSFGRQLSHLGPLTYPIDALRSILSKGWGIDTFPVLMALFTTSVYILLFLIIALFIYVKQISVY